MNPLHKALNFRDSFKRHHRLLRETPLKQFHQSRNSSVASAAVILIFSIPQLMHCALFCTIRKSNLNIVVGLLVVTLKFAVETNASHWAWMLFECENVYETRFIVRCQHRHIHLLIPSTTHTIPTNFFSICALGIRFELTSQYACTRMNIQRTKATNILCMAKLEWLRERYGISFGYSCYAMAYIALLSFISCK